MHVIGIAGKAGSGKNTFGGLLAGALVGRGYTVALDAFAVGVKRQARAVCGWDGEKDEFGRQLLQRIGDQGRSVSATHWTNTIMPRWAAPYEPDYLIMTDVRYPAEVRWVKAWARFSRLILVRGRGGLEGEAGQHSSETELDAMSPEAWDVAIDNGGLLDDLARDAENLAVQLTTTR